MHRVGAVGRQRVPGPRAAVAQQSGRRRYNTVTGEATIADGCAEAAAATRRPEMDHRQVVIHAVLLSSDRVA